MFVPGHVEQWFTILDFDGVGLRDLPVNSLKGFTSSMQRNFRGRMYRNVFFNAHWFIQGLWGTVKGWLDYFVQQKIMIPKSADLTSTLLEYIDENDLEEKFGGKKPNITVFWPPETLQQANEKTE